MGREARKSAHEELRDAMPRLPRSLDVGDERGRAATSLLALRQRSVHGREADMSDHDPINHPKHYTSHPSGIECIQVTQYMNFCVGNAIKYLWRAGLKGNAIDDLKKARWYIDCEIRKLSGDEK
jgi:hypothetical protein